MITSKTKIWAAVAIVGAAACTAAAWPTTQPKNYEDCILKNMQSVQNREAALAIRSACKKKFPTIISDDEFLGVKE